MGGTSPPKPSGAAGGTSNVMDLLGGLGLGAAANASPPARTVSNDLLGNVFGSSPKAMGGASAPKPAVDPLAGLFGNNTPAAAPKPTADPLAGLFGASPPSVTQAPAFVYTVYAKNDLTITLTAQPRAPGTPSVDLLATFKNSSMFASISDLLFQVAVPKSLKLMMQPATNTTVQAGGQETQLLRIENPSMV